MATAKKENKEFSASYRFKEGEVTSAILDDNGKLSLLDGGNTLDVYASWKDFVRQMGDKPTTDNDESSIISQLEQMLGAAQVIEVTVKGDGSAKKAAPAPKSEKKEEEKEMAVATKKAVAKKAAAPKAAKAKTEKVLNECLCGCGGMTGGNFAPGHDARVHGWGKKIARGDMKFSEIPAIAQKFLKDHGTVQGKKVA